MPFPYLGGALTGWETTQTVYRVSKSVVDHIPQEKVSAVADIPMVVQPMPKQEVARQPEEQRQWRHIVVLVKVRYDNLKIDDRIVYDEIPYRIQAKTNWRAGGYRRYELIEDYDVEIPEDDDAVTFDGETVLYNSEVVTYA